MLHASADDVSFSSVDFILDLFTRERVLFYLNKNIEIAREPLT